LSLDRSGTYTSLDYVMGQVQLLISKPEQVEKITVRLDGSHFFYPEG
jgi:hypothetical protein